MLLLLLLLLSMQLFQALGAEGGEQGKWVVKATSPQPGFPKAKYMRKIVVAIWEKTLSPPQLLRLIMDRSWTTDACVCMKMLVLILKVLQQGPPAMLRSYLAYVGFLEEVSTTWGNMGRAAPPGIHCVHDHVHDNVHLNCVQQLTWLRFADFFFLFLLSQTTFEQLHTSRNCAPC